MNDDERKALAEARGRVANLRAMFNKGGVQSTEPPAWKRRVPSSQSVKVFKLEDEEKKKKEKEQKEKEQKVVNNVLRFVQVQQRESDNDDRKTEDETKQELYTRVKSSETLLDTAIQERKLREEQERRVTQEFRHAMAKKSSYNLENDHAYNHLIKQKEDERVAEQKAKESLAQYTNNGQTFEAKKRREQRHVEEMARKKEKDTKNLYAMTTYSTEYDQSYAHYHKQRETTTKAELEAQEGLGKFVGGKTYFEEQLDEKKRLQQLDRKKEQHAKEAKSNFSSPDFDHAYVYAKEVAQVEKEAEEKAKAALSKYDQHDVSHEYVMKNGMMVLKRADSTGTSEAKRYPFTDPAARVKKSSPQAMKALAKFQAQLAETRAREEHKEQRASDEDSRKASWESTRKMSMESVESMEPVRQQPGEVDIEQIKASVDEANLDVRSAAQKFAEMDRKAAELAKQNKKPLTFNGLSYGHTGQAFRTKEKERKEVKHKNKMATRIQSRVRGLIARKAYSDKVSAAEKIAIFIQTQFRRHQAQKHVAGLRQRLQHEVSCAVAIQKIVRGRFQWNRYQTKVAVRKAAVVLLQSFIRSRQAQTAYAKQIKAVHDIQEFAARMVACRHARNEIACLRTERDAATVIHAQHGGTYHA
ncbi:unnamed protein product [Peronospora belbahrii]|uniref:Uncharacterized protein n=1 Tax=Peronospora belbahrii TaxID=622444 RepID=A0ABN8D789_9STRA|nr:unnamed protein product [Peronospora belbahrii]